MKHKLENQKIGILLFRKRSLLHWAAFLVAFWSFLIKIVGCLPGPLEYCKYFVDGILLVFLIFALKKKKHQIHKDVWTVLKVAIIYFLYTFIVYLFQYQSVAYFLWGFRNSFRFLIAFFIFIAYIDKRDADTWFKMIDVLFWINAILSIFQFVFLNMKGDWLGGIFGIKAASNAYTLVFFIIAISQTLLSTFEKDENYTYCLLKCGISFLIAAMAELKVYFVMFSILLVFCTIITRFSVKKMMLIFGAMAIAMLCSTLLVTFFGQGSALSLRGAVEYAIKENYSSQRDINRLSAIYTLSHSVIQNPINQIFGFGLGNCDTSSFEICNTPFFKQYGYMHYTWFTAPMIFLETGYIGLGFNLVFFFVCFLQAYKKYKNNSGQKLYNQLAMVVSFMCGILIFYNSSLRIEAAYMIYFVLALPYMWQSPGDKNIKQHAMQKTDNGGIL